MNLVPCSMKCMNCSPPPPHPRESLVWNKVLLSGNLPAVSRVFVPIYIKLHRGYFGKYFSFIFKKRLFIFRLNGPNIQTWSEAASLWNKHLRRADKGWFIIKINMLRNVTQEFGCEGEYWVHLAQDRDKWWTFVTV